MNEDSIRELPWATRDDLLAALEQFHGRRYVTGVQVVDVDGDLRLTCAGSTLGDLPPDRAHRESWPQEC